MCLHIVFWILPATLLCSLVYPDGASVGYPWQYVLCVKFAAQHLLRFLSVGYLNDVRLMITRIGA